VVPALYVVGASVILVVLLRYRAATTWPGLVLIASGLPVYFLFRAFSAHSAENPPRQKN
jgi:APA family basic amino acid/polyamine antiporter